MLHAHTLTTNTNTNAYNDLYYTPTSTPSKHGVYIGRVIIDKRNAINELLFIPSISVRRMCRRYRCGEISVNLIHNFGKIEESKREGQ